MGEASHSHIAVTAVLHWMCCGALTLAKEKKIVTTICMTKPCRVWSLTMSVNANFSLSSSSALTVASAPLMASFFFFFLLRFFYVFIFIFWFSLFFLLDGLFMGLLALMGLWTGREIDEDENDADGKRTIGFMLLF